eukprot:TRINITY_DN3332_c4_g1_i1.p1 TRINITY_DN3332_c4_g1~~TRINITY_DN3332_c4_g1_i1.p1  ORF type:complete len:639 (+),score=119.68 TRINITY_DN3332_c4_g1_i1:78-1994(+)
MAALIDQARVELRRDGVKLWLSPYTPPEGNALTVLASSYAGRLGVDAARLAAVLDELRLHALAKLQAKSQTNSEAGTFGLGGPSQSPALTLLGKVLGSNASQKELVVTVCVTDTGEHVRRRLCETLGVSQLKVISGGRSLQDGSTLLEQNWVGDHERDGAPLRVLILASGPPLREVNPSYASSADSSERVASADADKLTTPSQVEESQETQQCTVSQIRQAAEQLTAKGFGNFELFDANTGRLVPVPTAVRQALVTAIALHARGRSLLKSGTGDRGLAVALEFLVEADSCFERCRKAGAAELLERMTNFGQLQLDICWAYALLGDSGHLTDAEIRLQAAERMIRRQVDRNFLTLAEVKAEQGATLPPEVLPSVRLWLLRGIAKSCRGSQQAAREDLERAQLFIKALQVDEVAVSTLVAMGATRVEAVAALRRCGGLPDRAATDLLSAMAQRNASQNKRKEQLKLGYTADGSYLDPDSVSRLCEMGMDRATAIDALRKTNNDVDGAVALVQRNLEIQVDDLALATLMSMGYDRDAVEEVLRAVGGNDVDKALQLLASKKQGAEAAQGASHPGKTSTSAAKHEEHEKAKEQVEKEKAAYNAALELVERELGDCLTRRDLEDDFAGASLEDEELLLQKFLA